MRILNRLHIHIISLKSKFSTHTEFLIKNRSRSSFCNCLATVVKVWTLFIIWLLWQYTHSVEVIILYTSFSVVLTLIVPTPLLLRYIFALLKNSHSVQFRTIRKELRFEMLSSPGGRVIEGCKSLIASFFQNQPAGVLIIERFLSELDKREEIGFALHAV